jgi:ribosome biogenesis GTPase
MFKHKGKSQRRMKNWQQVYSSGQEESDVASLTQKVVPRAVKIPPWRQGQAADIDGLPRVEGLVVGLFPGGAAVSVEGRELLCNLAGTFRPPPTSSALAVGDHVTVALTRAEHADAQGDDKLRTDGMILDRKERKTALCRPQPRSGKRRDQYETQSFTKVIVANMDVLLIVVAVRQPPMRAALIDRALIVAQRGELSTMLVVNKIDLGEPDEEVLAEYSRLGVAIFRCSAAAGEGVPELAAALAGKSSVLAGASGVGKSSLINALIPGALAATRAVRKGDQRGRHTTARAFIYKLPNGGQIVDTPGVRELGMDMELSELPWYFPDFEPFAAGCKFNDCTHTHEPSCGVLAAVEEGKLPPVRYESYLRIFETVGRE